MSQAHEIEYSIFVYLDEAESDRTLLKNDNWTRQLRLFRNQNRTADAVEAGEWYRLFAYENDIRLLEIKDTESILPDVDCSLYRRQSQRKAQGNCTQIMWLNICLFRKARASGRD